jgi:TatD DNase family protein
MLFDAHSHVQFLAYDADRDEVISRAREAGVRFLSVGTQLSTSQDAVELARAYPRETWAAVGFHPSHASGTAYSRSWHHDRKEQAASTPEAFDEGAFRDLAADPLVVAIGECGLDYYRLTGGAAEKEIQRGVFMSQVRIAQDFEKALMIHCRPSKGTDDAYEDLLEILKVQDKRLRTVIHFYVGSPSVTEKLLNTGCSFTFGGVITFARDYDEAIRMIPMDRILTETDAPYVSPEPYRGKRNEPAYVVEVARKLAELKGLAYTRVAETTARNAEEIFGV